MPSRRIVLTLPVQPAVEMLAVAMDLRDFFERRGAVVSIRYGPESFDEDITPIDGVELPALLVAISPWPGSALSGNGDSHLRDS